MLQWQGEQYESWIMARPYAHHLLPCTAMEEAERSTSSAISNLISLSGPLVNWIVTYLTTQTSSRTNPVADPIFKQNKHMESSIKLKKSKTFGSKTPQNAVEESCASKSPKNNLGLDFHQSSMIGLMKLLSIGFHLPCLTSN